MSAVCLLLLSCWRKPWRGPAAAPTVPVWPLAASTSWRVMWGGASMRSPASSAVRSAHSSLFLTLSRSLSCLFRSLTCQKRRGVWVASSYYFFRTLIYWEFLLFWTFFYYTGLFKTDLTFFYLIFFIMNFLDRLKILIMIDTVATKPYPNLLHPCLT